MNNANIVVASNSAMNDLKIVVDSSAIADFRQAVIDWASETFEKCVSFHGAPTMLDSIILSRLTYFVVNEELLDEIGKGLTELFLDWLNEAATSVDGISIRYIQLGNDQSVPYTMFVVAFSVHWTFCALEVRVYANT